MHSLLLCKHTSSLPFTIPKPSLADSFASFFSDKVCSLRLKVSSNPSPMSSHSNPLLFIMYYHHFLTHLLMKLLNSPLLVDNVTLTLSYLPPETVSATIIHIITTIINLSISTCTFSIHFKQFLLLYSSKNHPPINKY